MRQKRRQMRAPVLQLWQAAVYNIAEAILLNVLRPRASAVRPRFLRKILVFLIHSITLPLR